MKFEKNTKNYIEFIPPYKNYNISLYEKTFITSETSFELGAE